MSETARQAMPSCPAARAAGRFGGALLLQGPGGGVSFRRFDQWVGVIAERLADQGVRRGLCVGVEVAPGAAVETLACITALMRLGAVACPMDARAPLAWRRARLADAGCHACVPPDGALEFLNADVPPMEEPAPALAVFTSGSTGAPKAAAHGLAGLTAAAQRAAAHLALGPGDRYLLSVPLFHVSGLSVLFRCLESGAVCVLPGAGMGWREALQRTGASHVSLVAAQLRQALPDHRALRALHAARVVLLGGGPTPAPLLARALAAGVPAMNSYGLTESAAMICATPILGRVETGFRQGPWSSPAFPRHPRESGDPVITTSHAPTQPSGSPLSRGRRGGGDCVVTFVEPREKGNDGERDAFPTGGSLNRGSHLPAEIVEVLATAGQPLGPDLIRMDAGGRISVGGDSLFLGYLRRGVLDRQPVAGGWFETGDLGAFDVRGNLGITGRADNMFISGGENIQPEAVEAALLALPGVIRAMVVPAPHPEKINIPVAVVEYAAGHAPIETELRAALAAKLPRHMVPWRFLPWPDEGKTEGFKPSRQSMAAWAAQDGGMSSLSRQA